MTSKKLVLIGIVLAFELSPLRNSLLAKILIRTTIG